MRVGNHKPSLKSAWHDAMSSRARDPNSATIAMVASHSVPDKDHLYASSYVNSATVMLLVAYAP